MKKLIFPLIFCSLTTFAQDEILTDAELSKKMISVVKEVQVEETLSQSKEFKDCRDKNKFDAKSGNNQASVEAAVKCFEDKLSNQRDLKALEKLSDALGLQSYGLVQSNNKKEISKFLSNKMYKALTGVDPNEQDLKKLMEQMKFKNKKQIDQKVFVQLYSTQLVKNALFEISRYCFENFRLASKGQNEESFVDYWKGELENLNDTPNTMKYTDVGSKGFGSVDTSSKESIYKDLLAGLGVNDPNNVKLLSNFFTSCSAKIVPLCDDYKPVEGQKESRGANSCLTKAKLQNAKKAIASAKKLSEDFDSMNVSQMEIQLGAYKKYEYGKGDGEKSVDDLTNYSSADLLDAKVVDTDKAEKCRNGGGTECDDLIVIDDSKDKIAHNMDMDYRLKAEVEKARVRELKAKSEQDLKTYLSDNGYFDILKEYENGDGKFDVEDAIAREFEKKRVAAIESFKSKVGSRQMSESEASVGNTKERAIKQNAQEVVEERARLAQVVMFNNIITGSLELSKEKADGSRETVGQNVSVLLNETNALKNSQIDQNLFQNLSKSVEGKTGNTENSSFADITFLDKILGK